MISPTVSPDFSNLLSTIEAKNLLHRLNELQSQKTNHTEHSINLEADASLKKLHGNHFPQLPARKMRNKKRR